MLCNDSWKHYSEKWWRGKKDQRPGSNLGPTLFRGASATSHQSQSRIPHRSLYWSYCTNYITNMHTVYIQDNSALFEVVAHNEGEVGSRADLCVPNGLMEGGLLQHLIFTVWRLSQRLCYVKLPLLSSSGDVAGIQYTSTQQCKANNFCLSSWQWNCFTF